MTRQRVHRAGYLEEFVAFWSTNPDTRQIWVSLYTPQIGEESAERSRRPTGSGGTPARAAKAVSEAGMPGLIKVYLKPPATPES